MPLAQKPSILRSSMARAAVTPKLTPAPCMPGTGAILTLSRATSTRASCKSRRSPISTQGAAPMLLPFTADMSPRRAPKSLCRMRNQYMPWACAPMSLTPCHSGKAESADEIDRAVAHRRIAFVDRIDHLQRDIEAFLLEEAELDRRDGGKVGVRDHVRDGEFHIATTPLCRHRVGKAKRAHRAWARRMRCAFAHPTT